MQNFILKLSVVGEILPRIFRRILFSRETLYIQKVWKNGQRVNFTWSLTSLPAAVRTAFQVAVALGVDGTFVDRLARDSGQTERNTRTRAGLRCRNTNTAKS